MLLAEYDYDTDIAVQRKEAFDDGILQGRNEGIAIGEERGMVDCNVKCNKRLHTAILNPSIF